jgi:hypothetical protein
LPQRFVHLHSHPPGRHASRETARFQNEDFAAEFEQSRRNARGLTRSRRGFEDEVRVFSKGLENLRD